MQDSDNVYHLAAKFSIVDSLSDPEKYEDKNVKGTFSVFKAASESGARNVISHNRQLFMEIYLIFP